MWPERTPEERHKGWIVGKVKGIFKDAGVGEERIDVDRRSGKIWVDEKRVAEWTRNDKMVMLSTVVDSLTLGITGKEAEEQLEKAIA